MVGDTANGGAKRRADIETSQWSVAKLHQVHRTPPEVAFPVMNISTRSVVDSPNPRRTDLPLDEDDIRSVVPKEPPRNKSRVGHRLTRHLNTRSQSTTAHHGCQRQDRPDTFCKPSASWFTAHSHATTRGSGGTAA